MAGTTTTTSDISYRTAGYMAKELLKRAQPLLCISRFGQAKPLPKESTKTIKFRGYQHLPNQPKALTEGVTPTASKPTYVDKMATLTQYGDWVELTDVIADTHEDPILNEFTSILGEQSAIMLERVTAGVVKSGTNVFFNGVDGGGVLATARDQVNKPITLELQRRVVRALKRQLAQPVTSMVSPSQNFNTSPIAPSYIAICHTDCEADIREMPGFVPVEKYGQRSELPGEVGSVEGVRYLTTTIMDAWEDAGSVSVNMVSTTGACADVYPVIFLGANAFGNVPFARGKAGGSPVTPFVLNPNVARGGDPLGQRGSVGWKALHAAVILYDFYLARAEVSVSLV